MNKIKNILFGIIFLCLYLFVKILMYFLFIIQIRHWYPKKKRSVLFLENFPIENAGYNYRAKKWSDLLVENKYNSVIKTIIANKNKFEKCEKFKHKRFLLFSILHRIKHIFQSLHYEHVIVRRTLLLYNEYGNLFMEKLLLSIHPNAILDFDDNMRLLYFKNSDNFYARILMEERDKFYKTLKKYRYFTVASDYLKQLVLNQNEKINENNILVLPTCVDYYEHTQKHYDVKPSNINFGWIGTTGNQENLDIVVRALNNIVDENSIQLVVISGKAYQNLEAKFNIVNVNWSLETEIDELLKIDIGLMPLDNTNVSKGKGGFKLVQYMGLGIVSIASAVTINKEIIDDGINGFLVYDYKDWTGVLKKVVDLWPEYSEIGKKAREKINMNYSFNANFEKLIKFLNR